MDKETLSQYGWIVIVVIVLALMLGLASPLASTIGNSISETVGGFSQKATASLEKVKIPGAEDSSNNETDEPETPEEQEVNKLILKAGAPYEAIIDTRNKGDFTGSIYGFDTLGNNENWEVDGTVSDFVTTTLGDDYLEIIPSDGGETTGAVINILDEEDNVVESYVFIYFGDVDMDGDICGYDASMCNNYETLHEGIDTLCQFIAGDINGDGIIGITDGSILFNYALFYEGMMSQSEIATLVKNHTYTL